LENGDFADLAHYLEILENNPTNTDVTNEILAKELVRSEEK